MRKYFEIVLAKRLEKPCLSDNDKMLETIKKNIDAKLKICKVRLNTVLLLCNNERFDDALLIYKQLINDIESLGIMVGCCIRDHGQEDLPHLNLKLNHLGLEKALHNCRCEMEHVFLNSNCIEQLHSITSICIQELESAVDDYKKACLKTPLDQYIMHNKIRNFFHIVILGFLGWFLWSYFFVTLPQKRNMEIAMTSSSQIRIQDLSKITKALKQYYETNHNYPLGVGPDGNFDGNGNFVLQWIPGLIPDYIDRLPNDPRNSSLKNEQYFYWSDGKDYKLISHAAEDCKYVKEHHPELIDPVRDCWAYGYWSKNAAKW